MCGICGVWEYGASEGSIESSLLARMRDEMTHRGPDDAGELIFDERRGGFGFRRLSIIDLSAAGRVPGAAREALDDLTAIERLHAAKTGALFAAAAELGAISAGAPSEMCAALGRYGLAIGIAFQHADDRDDAELVEHAAAAAERMRVLCSQALAEVRPLSSPLLDGFAAWIASRA